MSQLEPTNGNDQQSVLGDIMNVKEYKDKKARGLAEVVKAGGGYAFAVKRFNPNDGTELDPEIISINIEELVNKKAELELEVADYTALISDAEKLKL